ncbi:MAG: hypothetical protein IJ198_12975 [Lachnospiraceae bacterium]|nr:hypothetical protein [Lachnospiraceae bacterium]
MAILLTVLKWIGIILLILLVIVLVILLLVLFVPFRYKGRAGVSDPECHEEFPVSVLKERSDVNFDVSWLGGLIKVAAVFPSRKIVSLKVFGKEVWSTGRKKSAEEENEPEKEEEEKEEDTRSLCDKLEDLFAKVEKFFDFIDYVHRVLTGRCGRRAWEKVKVRLGRIGGHIAPQMWKLSGNIGLNDPCLNGNMNIAYSVIKPFTEDHLKLETEWDLYRCNLEAAAAGKIQIFVPVKETVPLLFDKDCRKVFKKLLKAKAKLK